jgi:YHS domain-containing protein
MKSTILEFQINKLKRMSKKSILILFIVLSSTISFAQTIAKRTKEFNLEKGVAIQGYDPVAYFLQKKAVKGKSNLTTTFEGVIYYFSIQANKDAFTKNPASYEPQYGGWCAYAMGSAAEKVEIDPETFKIVDGKLYVFTTPTLIIL